MPRFIDHFIRNPIGRLRPHIDALNLSSAQGGRLRLGWSDCQSSDEVCERVFNGAVSRDVNSGAEACHTRHL